MPEIRPEPRDTSFETPAIADTGAGEYYKNLVYDALYHSPVGTLGAFGGPMGGVGRFSELYGASHDTDDLLLTPERAKQDYGLEGELKFDEPIREGAAQIMHDRKIAELRREYLLQSGLEDHWGRKFSGFGVSMVSTLIDPVNLASMFVPVVGENTLLSGVSRAKSMLGKGLISPKTLAGLTGTTPLAYRLGKGAIEGLVGTAITEPLNIIPTLQEQGHYEWTDTLTGLAVGAGLGAGLHALVGAFHDHFKAVKAGLLELDPQTHEAALMAAVSDLVKDEHITSPAKVIEVDHKLVENDLQRVNNDHIFQIAEEQRARLQAMKDAGVPMSPVQESRLRYITMQLSNPNYTGYQTAKELAQFFNLQLDPKAKEVPKQFAGLINQVKSAHLPDEAEKMLAQVLSKLPPEIRDKISISKIVSGIDFPKEWKGAKAVYREASRHIEVERGEVPTQDLILHEVLHDYVNRNEELYAPYIEEYGEYDAKEAAVHQLIYDLQDKGLFLSDESLTSPEAVHQETQSRVQKATRQESNPTPEKSIDTPPTADKSLGVEPIQEAPEPIEELPPDEMTEVHAELDKAITSLEKHLILERPDKVSEEDEIQSVLDTDKLGAPKPEGKSKFDLFLDSLKSGNKPGDMHMFGLIPEAWDGLIEAIRTVYHASKDLEAAIEKGIAWLKKNHPGQKLDEEGFKAHMLKDIEDKVDTSVHHELIKEGKAGYEKLLKEFKEQWSMRAQTGEIKASLRDLFHKDRQLNRIIEASGDYVNPNIGRNPMTTDETWSFIMDKNKNTKLYNVMTGKWSNAEIKSYVMEHYPEIAEKAMSLRTRKSPKDVNHTTAFRDRHLTSIPSGIELHHNFVYSKLAEAGFDGRHSVEVNNDWPNHRAEVYEANPELGYYLDKHYKYTSWHELSWNVLKGISEEVMPKIKEMAENKFPDPIDVWKKNVYIDRKIHEEYRKRFGWSEYSELNSVDDHIASMMSGEDPAELSKQNKGIDAGVNCITNKAL